MTTYINRTTSEEDILYGQVQKVGRLYILQQLVIVSFFLSVFQVYVHVCREKVNKDISILHFVIQLRPVN